MFRSGPPARRRAVRGPRPGAGRGANRRAARSNGVLVERRTCRTAYLRKGASLDCASQAAAYRPGLLTSSLHPPAHQRVAPVTRTPNHGACTSSETFATTQPPAPSTPGRFRGAFGTLADPKVPLAARPRNPKCRPAARPWNPKCRPAPRPRNPKCRVRHVPCTQSAALRHVPGTLQRSGRVSGAQRKDSARSALPFCLKAGMSRCAALRCAGSRTRFRCAAPFRERAAGGARGSPRMNSGKYSHPLILLSSARRGLL